MELAHFQIRPHLQAWHPNWEPLIIFGMVARSGKTAYPKVGIWFDEARGDIHLSIPGHGLSTVNADPGSKRGNPHLFNKLAKALRDEGKPHPPVNEDWNDARRRRPEP